jgi:hypothetical protein
MTDESELERIVEGSGCGPTQDTFPEFAMEGLNHEKS